MQWKRVREDGDVDEGNNHSNISPKQVRVLPVTTRDLSNSTSIQSVIFDPAAATAAAAGASDVEDDNNRFHPPCCAGLVKHFPKMQIKSLLSLSIPVAISAFASFAINTVNLSFVGHLSARELAGAALGNSLMNLTGYAVMNGLCSAVDTLCSQSYGAGQKKLVGLVAMRASLAFTLVLFPILVLWMFTEQIYVATGQEADISALAGQYVRYGMSTIFPSLWSECIRRFLQAQSITKPQVAIAVMANIIHIIACYLLIFQADLGLIGAPIAYSITQWCIFFMYLLYVRFFNYRVWMSTIPPCHLRALIRGWGQLYRLGLPGMLMLLTEWGSFEMMAIASGWLSPTDLDCLVVIMNLAVTAFMIPLSIAISVSTLVGNALGANQPQEARLFARAAQLLGLCFILLEFLLVGSARHYLAAIYTNQTEVLQEFSQVFLLLLMLLPFDCMQGIMGGVIRGAGWQSLGAKTNVVAYYLLGLPLGLSLAFWAGVGLEGILLGLIMAVVFATAVYGWRIAKLDWKAEAEKALRRIAEEKEGTGTGTGTGAIEGMSSSPVAEYDEEGVGPQSVIVVGASSDMIHSPLPQPDNALEQPSSSASSSNFDCDDDHDHQLGNRKYRSSSSSSSSSVSVSNAQHNKQQHGSNTKHGGYTRVIHPTHVIIDEASLRMDDDEEEEEEGEEEELQLDLDLEEEEEEDRKRKQQSNRTVPASASASPSVSVSSPSVELVALSPHPLHMHHMLSGNNNQQQQPHPHPHHLRYPPILSPSSTNASRQSKINHDGNGNGDGDDHDSPLDLDLDDANSSSGSIDDGVLVNDDDVFSVADLGSQGDLASFPTATTAAASTGPPHSNNTQTTQKQQRRKQEQHQQHRGAATRNGHVVAHVTKAQGGAAAASVSVVHAQAHSSRALHSTSTV